jgi:pilus assembly protein CpaB
MNRAAPFTLGGSSRLGLILAGILAAVTGIVVFAVLQSADGDDTVSNQSGGAATLVVTAAQEIPARTEITADMIEVTRVDENAVLAGAYPSTDLVVGKVARIPILAGEQIVPAKVANESERAELGLAYIVPPGMRDMALEVDLVISPCGLTRPGDRVDVVGVVDINYQDIESGKSINMTRSITLAQNIEVLAVEQKLENRPVSTAGDSATTEGTATSSDGTLVEQPDADPESTVVTLALTPLQAQNVMLSDEKGAVRLAVRAPGDTEIVDQPDSTPLGLSDEEFQTFINDLLKQIAAEEAANQ